MELLADLLIAGPALFFLGMGLWALAWPTRVVDRFDTEVRTVDGRNEIRAVYGGFGIVTAAVLGWAVFTDGNGEMWIPSVVSILVLGMALGRVISFALDRTKGSAVTWQFVGLELVLAAALFGSHVVR